MDGYLLDTNHLSDTLRPVSRLRDRIHQGRHKGIRFRTCIPVVCEVEVGIQQSSRPDRFYRMLNQVLREVRLWPLDLEVARLYGEIYLSLRRQGRVLSHVDIILAAFAKLMKVTLLTADRDFEALSDIRTANWLS